MFDTYVTLVGNVLTPPEWRRTKNTGSLVANFKVASTARRLDRESGQWVDGNSFRVRVTCWRRLAEGVGASLITGDPVIVVGRLYTRDWVDENSNRRIGYELEAVAVGHDLSRGQSRFLRARPNASTNAMEDEQDAARVGGELTEPVPAGQVPVRRDDRVFDDFELPVAPVGALGAPGRYDPLGKARDELTGADDDLGDELSGDELTDDGLVGTDLPGTDLAGADLSGDDLADVGFGDERVPVSFATGEPELEPGDAEAGDGEEKAGRGRRRRTRVPV